MSGDVQPRKRKDKRRRRDDDESVPLVRSGSTEHSDNVTIHVHKETGTGGHWCARIIFFALLAGLLGVVGLIILEHRGASDVDTPVTASQWAMIFEGWVDEAPAQHDDEHEVAADDQLEDSHEEDEGHGSEHQDEDEEEEATGEEDDDDAEECSKPDEEEPEADKTISEEETDEGLGDDDDDDESPPDYEESNNDEGDDASPEKGDEDADGIENEDTGEDEGYSKEDFDDAPDDLEALEEIEGDDDVNDDNAEDENGAAAFDSDLDFSIEGIKAPTDDDHEFPSFTEDDAAEEYISIPGVNEIDDNSAEPLEEIDGEEPEEIINEVNNVDEDEEEKQQAEQILEEESTSVAMKFGVGIALIIAAHFVLVRRWNNGDAEAPEILTNSDEVPNLSRRNTLVPPGRIKEVILKKNDQETTLNKEQEQTYEDLRSTYKTVISKDKKGSDVENIFSKKTADLQSILFGGSKDTKTNLSAENKERQTKEEEEEEEEEEYSEDENDYEDDEEYEDEDVEEDYEDEVEEGDERGEEEGEEEEEVEEVDDTELVEKLDKKYGKLPTPPDSDQEEEEEEEGEDDEEEEDEIEEEDDELAGWKRVKVPIVGNRVMESGKESKSKPKSGGQQGDHDYLDDSLEDLRITEKPDSISSKVPGF